MEAPSVQFLSAVLIVSEDPARLVPFYRDALGLALHTEDHGGLATHYGCELGDVHFAIHPVANFAAKDPARAHGAVKLAFTVFDMAATVARLRAHGVEPLYPPVDGGFAVMTAVRDPDGNYVELTQLSDAWFEHLAARHARGHDVVAAWKRHKTG